MSKSCDKNRASKKGIFITFEGVEGSGKTTQVSLLKDYFNEGGLDSLFVREPGSTLLSEKIRCILLDTEISIEPLSELFLFLSARTQITKDVIIPALKNARIVVCDRFADATVAYQGYGRGLNIALINKLNLEASYNTIPDLTFLLDISVEDGFKRLNTKHDRMERESIEFHKRVREGYLKIASLHKERVVVIDALKRADEIQNIVREKVFRKFPGVFKTARLI